MTPVAARLRAVFRRVWRSHQLERDMHDEMRFHVDMETEPESPRSHEHLRPRVLAYGGESPGDRSVFELVLTHLPVLLVLIVACVNVGTLLYARTATRDAEIAMRTALGASGGRIVAQLFVEALVLASGAAVLGLAAAHVALKWGINDLAWRVDVPQMVAGGTIVAIVSLGLFLSAAGIFSLMSVSVARRTRELGLRAALGASRTRLIAGVFSRAAVLVGSGVAAGNGVLLVFVMLQTELALSDVATALVITAVLMLMVGMLACFEPARRAIHIDPMEALKDA